MDSNRYLPSSSSSPHLDQMLQLDYSWISSYFSDDDAPFEPSAITMPEISIPQNQSIENSHGVSLPCDCHLPSSSAAPHLDQNPDPAMMPPNQMQQFHEPWIPSYFSDDDAAFEPSEINMLPEMNIPQNQSIEDSHGFSLPGESKTEAEIARDNYLKIYSAIDDPLPYLEGYDFGSSYADSSLIETVTNWSSEAEFDLMNYNFASMTNFPQLNHLNINNIEVQEQNLYASCTAPVHCNYLSDIVHSCSTTVKSLPPRPRPPPPPPPYNAISNRGRTSRINNWNWSIHEHNLFLVGMNIFGKGDWKSIARRVVLTKSHIQVASHAQKYINHQFKSEEDRKRRSIHDINTVDPILLMQVRANLGLPPI